MEEYRDMGVEKYETHMGVGRNGDVINLDFWRRNVFYRPRFVIPIFLNYQLLKPDIRTYHLLGITQESKKHNIHQK